MVSINQDSVTEPQYSLLVSMVLSIVNFFLGFVGYTLEPICGHEEQKRKIEIQMGQRKRIKSSVEAKDAQAVVAPTAQNWNLEPDINFSEDCPTPINIVKKKFIAPSESFEKSIKDEPKRVIVPSKSFEDSICDDNEDEADVEEVKESVVFVSSVNVRTTTFSTASDSFYSVEDLDTGKDRTITEGEHVLNSLVNDIFLSRL